MGKTPVGSNPGGTFGKPAVPYGQPKGGIILNGGNGSICRKKLPGTQKNYSQTKVLYYRMIL
jgi:hypothetical protein